MTSKNEIDTLPDRTVFKLDTTNWEKFQDALSAPPRDLPRMRKLLREQGVFGSDASKTPPKCGLSPVIYPTSTVLILGTLPGEESLRLQQYYAQSRNHFWKILGEVFGEPVGAEYLEKLDFLFNRGLALWDVLQTAERQGSLDSAIRNGLANNLGGLIAAHPNLKVIALNGGRAKKEFDGYRKSSAAEVTWPQVIALPSSSDTPGKNVKSFDEKVACWSILAQLSSDPQQIAENMRYNSSILG